MLGIGEARTARDTDGPPATAPGTSDVDLVGLVARGDSEAFALLYDRYGPTAYRLAYRITASSQLAETVVQEMFLTIWRQAARFDARRARPATWILTIAHHKAVDVVRSEQLRRTEPAEQIADVVDESVDLPRDAWLGEQRDQVRRALAALPALQREVIELAYFTGYSQSQLAHLLEQPLGTVKSRTHAALARLRTLLEGEGITSESVLAAG